jgi:uncharacterized membrane protein
MAIGLGLLAALAYGLSDFVGGLLSRRIHYTFVSAISYGVAVALIGLAMVVVSSPAPSNEALLWGAASGVGSGLGTLALFRGLARGRMGVVAPLSAVGTAVLPVVAGVALGDRPSGPAWAGVAVALPAIWLVSTTTESPATAQSSARSPLASGALEGLAAGLGFGLLLIGLNLAGEGSGLWPVIAGQGTAFVLLVVLALVTLRGGRRERIQIDRRASGPIALVGLFGAVAVIAYFFSTQAGLLSIVAVLTSLYPAATVLLATVVLREPILRRQAIGLALAGLAVVLIVLA